MREIIKIFVQFHAAWIRIETTCIETSLYRNDRFPKIEEKKFISRSSSKSSLKK